MGLPRCIECGEEVVVQLSGGAAPYVGRLTKPPIRVLCPACVARLQLAVVRPRNALPRVVYHDQLFLSANGPFVRSDHPEAAYIFDRR